MVFMDQTGAKIGVTLWQELFPEFEVMLHCGSAYVIQNIKVVENHSKYKVSRIPFLVYLVKTTSVKEAKHPMIPTNVHVITPFVDIIDGVAPRDTLEEYALQLNDAIEKNYFDRKPLVVMLTLAEIKDPKGYYDGSGDDIKVSPPCVDELLGKTWVVRFKYRVQMRQSSVLDVTKDEYLIQTMTSTIALHVSIDYDPELFVFVTPAKRLSDQQDSSELQSDEYTLSYIVKVRKADDKYFFADGLKEFEKFKKQIIMYYIFNFANVFTGSKMLTFGEFHQCQVVGRALPTEADQHPKIYRMNLWATNEVRAKSKFWYFLRKLKKVKKRNDQVLAIKEVTDLTRLNHEKQFVNTYEDKEELHYKSLIARLPKMRGLTSHSHERLYTLGIKGDGRRRGMDKGREGGNDSRKWVFPV
ncbi:hypothetical protein JHK82_048344 [Glycine max]|nr:hypothetical protein JHK82_048344 [Glycine max]